MAVPQTWPELQTRFAARNVEEPQSAVTTAIGRMRAVREDPFGSLQFSFTASSNIYGRIAILIGPDSCRPIFEAQGEFFESAVEEAEQEPVRRVPLAASRLSLAGFANLARCTDCPLPASFANGRRETALVEWAIENSKRTLDEFQRETAAAAATALGETALALRVMKRKSAPKFQPGALFHYNSTGLIANLISAVKVGAAYKDVSESWMDALRHFPVNLASETIDWDTLMWIARIVHARIGGLPVGSVVERVRADIAALQVLRFPRIG